MLRVYVLLSSGAGGCRKAADAMLEAGVKRALP